MDETKPTAPPHITLQLADADTTFATALAAFVAASAMQFRAPFWKMWQAQWWKAQPQSWTELRRFVELAAEEEKGGYNDPDNWVSLPTISKPYARKKWIAWGTGRTRVRLEKSPGHGWRVTLWLRVSYSAVAAVHLNPVESLTRRACYALDCEPDELEAALKREIVSHALAYEDFVAYEAECGCWEFQRECSPEWEKNFS